MSSLIGKPVHVSVADFSGSSPPSLYVNDVDIELFFMHELVHVGAAVQFLLVRR